MTIRGIRKTDRYDAAKDLAERWPGWTVQVTDLAGVPESFRCSERRLLIDEAEWPEGLQFAVAHALAHLDLGHHEVAVAQFTVGQEADADWLAQLRLDLPSEEGGTRECA